MGYVLTHLAIRWINDGTEDAAKFGHVAIIWGQPVDIKALGVEGADRDVTRVQPITDRCAVQESLPVQGVLRLEGGFLGDILDKAVSLVVTCDTGEEEQVVRK